MAQLPIQSPYQHLNLVSRVPGNRLAHRYSFERLATAGETAPLPVILSVVILQLPPAHVVLAAFVADRPVVAVIHVVARSVTLAAFGIRVTGGVFPGVHLMIEFLAMQM